MTTTDGTARGSIITEVSIGDITTRIITPLSMTHGDCLGGATTTHSTTHFISRAITGGMDIIHGIGGIHGHIMDIGTDRITGMAAASVTDMPIPANWLIGPTDRLCPTIAGVTLPPRMATSAGAQWPRGRIGVEEVPPPTARLTHGRTARRVD